MERVDPFHRFLTGRQVQWNNQFIFWCRSIFFFIYVALNGWSNDARHQIIDLIISGHWNKGGFHDQPGAGVAKTDKGPV